MEILDGERSGFVLVGLVAIRALDGEFDVHVGVLVATLRGTVRCND